MLFFWLPLSPLALAPRFTDQQAVVCVRLIAIESTRIEMGTIWRLG